VFHPQAAVGYCRGLPWPPVDTAFRRDTPSAIATGLPSRRMASPQRSVRAAIRRGSRPALHSALGQPSPRSALPSAAWCVLDVESDVGAHASPVIISTACDGRLQHALDALAWEQGTGLGQPQGPPLHAEVRDAPLLQCESLPCCKPCQQAASMGEQPQEEHGCLVGQGAPALARQKP
jgi:hypothetical protein